MPNTNCLEGWKCPKCGHTDSFTVRTECTATLTDDGTEDAHEFDWNDDSFAQCTECMYHGDVADFMAEDDDTPPAPRCTMCSAPLTADGASVVDDGVAYCSEQCYATVLDRVRG